MNDFAAGLLTAVWLGILTSISPCPLATNIAAISFVARHITRPRTVLLSGALYALGRMLTYVLVAALIVKSILSIPDASYFLQKYMNKALGPLLVLVGMILLELIVVKPRGSNVSEWAGRRAGGRGICGAGILGIVFALSFCPVSAALFFGSLVPLSLKHGSVVALPAMFGLGSGLPVVVFAVLLSVGMRQVAAIFQKLTQVELWLRRLTGVVFVAAGVYLSLVHIFHVAI
jgi:cytochrome c-type biogenesis protein